MSEYNTVKGQAYAVTARGASSVTDENGLNLSVEAGGQAVFVASTDKAEVSGDHVLVQCREGSSIPGAGGGGGEVDPSNFVSKVEFDTFKEGNEQALEGKQDKLTAGEGISIVDNTISATGVVSKEPVELETVPSTLLLELDFSLNRVPSYGAMMFGQDGEVSEETDYVWNKVLTRDNVDEWIAFLNSNTVSSTLLEYSKVVDGSRCLLKCKSLREGLLIWIMPDGAHLSDPQYPWHETNTYAPGASVGGGVLKDKVKYHFEVAGDQGIGLQSITPEEYGTCELWLDVPAGSPASLYWPSVWEWKDPDEAPVELDPGYRYCLVLRHDGLGVLVSINYQRKLP